MLLFISALLLFIFWQIASLLFRAQFESAICEHQFKRAQVLARFLKSDDSLVAMRHLLTRLNNKQAQNESPQLIKASKEQMILIKCLAKRVGDWSQIIEDYSLLTSKKAKKKYRKLHELAQKELTKLNQLEDKR